MYFLSSLFQIIQRELSTINNTYFHPDNVLSTKNREECIRKLKIIQPLNKITEETKKAAVLVPLCLYEKELGFLYTLRSTKLTTNRGQVSFPGGIKDDSDENFEQTALRETWEELQIPKEQIDVWTRAYLIGRKNVNVMPILGYIGEINPNKLNFNPEEVDEAFVVSLKDLCQPKHCRYTQFRNNYTLPTYIGGKYRIWGLTAMITHIIMKALVPDVYQHKLIFLPPIQQFVKAREGNKPIS